MGREGGQKSFSVLIFPWLAHGHISPSLELAKKLAKRDFVTYLCSTPANLSSIRSKLSTKGSISIQLVELHLPSLPDLTPQYHTTKALPPHLMPALKTALDMSAPSFYNILKNLKPDLLIYDFLQPWAPTLASSLNIPAVNFSCFPASVMSYILHFAKNPGGEFPFHEISLPDQVIMKLQHMLEASSNEINDVDRALQGTERSSNIILIKTSKELEGKYINYIGSLLRKKIVPLGPLVQDPIYEDGDHQQIEVITQWLDKKEKGSTVFVSFGSEYFLSKEEREEVAHGLELSKVNFIWVIRFPAGEKLKLQEALPQGYLERLLGKGLVLEEWAPQVEILKHPSVGGFVSHCGWNSTLESMKFGVPIIAMPMNIDQPVIARVVEDVGVGIEVRRNKSGGLDREEIATTIREVVVEKSGEGVRKKAKEMSDHMKGKGEEEMNEVAEELVKLCEDRTN